MTVSASKDAIGEVSEFLRTRIGMHAGITVGVGRPEALPSETGPKLNLFLFQIELDPHLKNVSLDEGQAPPLWMVLRYLLTAVDETHETDSVKAHRILGRGLAALQELNFIKPSVPALSSNPEPLKISFEKAEARDLSVRRGEFHDLTTPTWSAILARPVQKFY